MEEGGVMENLYLVPSIEEGNDQEPVSVSKNRQVFDQIKGARVYSKIDWRSGYHQL
jgi:hypothetical protein